MTRNERLQRLFHDYERHIGKPATIAAAMEWGLAKGRAILPEVDPRSVLIRDMKNALRAETAIDDDGREYRVNAAVTFTSNGGVQEAFWGSVDSQTTAGEFVSEWIGQRRKGVVDDCVKLKTDVDHYNSAHSDRKPIQLVLDFTDDVAEKEAARDFHKDDGPDGSGDSATN